MRGMYPRILCLTSILLAILAVACSPLGVEAPTPIPVELQSLLVSLPVLPQGWEIYFPAQADTDVGVHNIYVAFRLTRGYGLTQQQVYLFPTESEALEFWGWESAGFAAERLTPWQTPAELAYESAVADQDSFICADFAGGPFGVGGVHTLCQAAARYGRYVSVFSTWPSPQYMTWLDVERILQDIDRRMESRAAQEGR